MSDFKIIFIHGYTASSKSDWYPAISKVLSRFNIDFAIPDLPGVEHPHADKWLEKIHKEVLKTRKPLILVGHSLGSRAVLLYLEKYHLRVEKVFLVAAFANRIENAKRNDGKAYPDFFTHKIECHEETAFRPTHYVRGRAPGDAGVRGDGAQVRHHP